MTLQKLALGVEHKLLGQTLPISAAHGCGLHTNFGPVQGICRIVGGKMGYGPKCLVFMGSPARKGSGSVQDVNGKGLNKGHRGAVLFCVCVEKQSCEQQDLPLQSEVLSAHFMYVFCPTELQTKSEVGSMQEYFEHR